MRNVEIRSENADVLYGFVDFVDVPNIAFLEFGGCVSIWLYVGLSHLPVTVFKLRVRIGIPDP